MLRAPERNARGHREGAEVVVVKVVYRLSFSPACDRALYLLDASAGAERTRRADGLDLHAAGGHAGHGGEGGSHRVVYACGW